jgi:electron transport complex protein RnfC
VVDFFGLGKKTFAHGVHPREFKGDTDAGKIRRLPFAPELILPLSQHFGAPSIPIVHPSEEVVRGQQIARADGFMSVPLHAPVSGVIRSIGLLPTAKGPRTESIVLQAHAGASQEVLYEEPRDIDDMTAGEIIEAVQDTGVVGLGGAAFPTHVKMAVPKGHTIDTVLVNGCECEPYLTTDHRVMLESSLALFDGIRIAMRAVGAERAIIGIEDNKPDSIEMLEAQLPSDGSITVTVLKTKYPQGAEKILIKAALNREVPSGGYPSAVGVSVYNVATLAQLGFLLPRGRGLIERVVTVAGPGIAHPGNYLTALGTPLRFVLEQLGFTGSASDLILGGPMMGFSAASLDAPVTKGTCGILALTSEVQGSEAAGQISRCIRCAACLRACPLNLNPCELGLLAAKREYERMEDEFYLNDCFECGCCSYVCPSAIPLVQYFRIAKAVNRERREEAA